MKGSMIWASWPLNKPRLCLRGKRGIGVDSHETSPTDTKNPWFPRDHYNRKQKRWDDEVAKRGCKQEMKNRMLLFWLGGGEKGVPFDGRTDQFPLLQSLDLDLLIKMLGKSSKNIIPNHGTVPNESPKTNRLNWWTSRRTKQFALKLAEHGFFAGSRESRDLILPSYTNPSQMRRMYGWFSYMKGETWPHEQGEM